MNDSEYLKIEKEHIKNSFQKYVADYDITDEKIRLKVEHTYRVADICEKIAEKLELSEYDIKLAWFIGMMHDVGRFEQLRRFGTFIDAESINHAHYAVNILFEQGKLSDYTNADRQRLTDIFARIHSPQKEQADDLEIIARAVWNHSEFRIEEGLDKRTMIFCKIIRDADKIDILKVANDFPLEVIYNTSKEKVVKENISEKVMQQFMEKHTITREVRKTAVDHLVGHIALVFELEYGVSRQIVKEQGYLKKLVGFHSQNQDTIDKFQTIKQIMAEYM